jgi:serine/threonine-protein kinase
MSLRIGDAGYRILAPIAMGGAGEVYKAEHVITKRVEAIKVLSAPDTEAASERFLREIRLQASLNHPHIAAVYNAFRFEQNFVMVMELVEGEPLRSVLERGRLPVPIAVNIVSQLLDALAYAHAHGVIHRDITPSNIILTTQGVIKLTDFGLAKDPACMTGSDAGIPLGSPHYMSPEQVRDGSSASVLSDIYSTGAVLYELVTGWRAFPGESPFLVMQAQVENPPVPPCRIDPALPPALNDAILQSLEKDPARRFPSAEAFRAALEAALYQPAAPALPPPPAPRHARSRVLVAAMGIAAAGIVLLPSVFYMRRNLAERKRPTTMAPVRRPQPTIPMVLDVPGQVIVQPPAATLVPAGPAAPESKPTPMTVPASRQGPAQSAKGPARSAPRQARAARRDLTPSVTGGEANPAEEAGGGLPAPPEQSAAQPVAAAAPTPAAEMPAPQPPESFEPAPDGKTAIPPAAGQTGGKRPPGRIRRALGKIFGRSR